MTIIKDARIQSDRCFQAEFFLARLSRSARWPDETFVISGSAVDNPACQHRISRLVWGARVLGAISVGARPLITA